MAKIFEIEKYRNELEVQKQKVLSIDKVFDEIQNVETLSKTVNEALNKMCTENKEFSRIVTFAIGKFAAMNLFQKYGRAKTLSFFNECIETAEICNDILNQLDEDNNKIS